MRVYKKEVQQRADEKRRNNPERIAYMKNLQRQPHIVKQRNIRNWKKWGVINDDFDVLYDLYLSKTHCDNCNHLLIKGDGKYKKTLDHDHETGLFRNVLCNNCNLNCNKEERKLRTNKRFPIKKTLEEIKETNKKWNIKYECECGSTILKKEKSRHSKSKKHLNFINPEINI